MARVVQRRTSPPYLLILFVFTTVIALVLAVVFWNSADSERKARQEAERNAAALAKSHELNNVTVAPMLEAAKTRGPSVVQQFQGVISGLVTQIQGTETTADAALAAAQGIRADLKSDLGLVGLLKSKEDALTDALKRLAAVTGERDAALATVSAKDKALNDVRTELEAQIAELTKQHTAKQAEFTKLSEDYNASIEATKQDFARRIDEKNAELARKDQEVQKARQDMMMLENQLSILRQKIKELQPQLPIEPLLARADGEIVTTQLDYGVVYINIGSKDRVTVGLPFSVYSPREGIPQDGQGKAAIRVISVQDNVSACRVVSSSKENPILPGDLVANVAFDTSRTYTFVVTGDFDLDGDGKVDDQGNARIKDMILSYGGRIADAVGPNTDFVVMGVEPTPPPRPAADAPPSTLALYRDKLAEADAYAKTKADAAALQIPLLNTNRFLALVGYQPGAAE